MNKDHLYPNFVVTSDGNDMRQDRKYDANIVNNETVPKEASELSELCKVFNEPYALDKKKIEKLKTIRFLMHFFLLKVICSISFLLISFCNSSINCLHSSFELMFLVDVE